MSVSYDSSQLDVLSDEELWILCYDEAVLVYKARLTQDSSRNDIIAWLTGTKPIIPKKEAGPSAPKPDIPIPWPGETRKWVLSGIIVVTVISIIAMLIPFNPRITMTQESGDNSFNIQNVGGDVEVNLPPPPTPTSTPTPKPQPMSGDFNIAVAEFVEITEEGRKPSQISREISQDLFDFFDSQITTNNAGLLVEVSNKHIGSIEGESGEGGAEALARRYNWHMVFYGSVSINDDIVKVRPRVYVVDQPNTQPIKGVYEFVYTLPYRPDQDLTKELRRRATTLILFVQGLILLSSNEADYLKRASSFFLEAITESDRLVSFEGKEVFYLSYAHSRLRLRDHETALIYAEKAHNLNPENASTYIGLGQFYYDVAISIEPFDDVLLDKALDQYDLATEFVDSQDILYTNLGIKILQANVYFVKSIVYDDLEFASLAENLYEDVINFYKAASNKEYPILVAKVASAYSGLGYVYQRQGNLYLAEDAFNSCITLTMDRLHREECKQKLDEIQSTK